MRLLELHIDGFGKFHDRTISFNDGINIIYGKNEAGKSTLHTFIRGMLFGIERGRGRAAKNDLYTKYEPWENSGTYEGWLRLEKDGWINSRMVSMLSCFASSMNPHVLMTAISP